MIRNYAVPLSLIFLLLFLLGIGWGDIIILNKNSDQLLASASQLEKYISAEDWEQATEAYHEVQEKWRKMSRYWPMLIHHQEMDRIEENLTKLESYLKYEEAADAQAELKTLMKVIEHIPKKEHFNVQNLF